MYSIPLPAVKSKNNCDTTKNFDWCFYASVTVVCIANQSFIYNL